MKARVFKTESQIRKVVQDEAKRQTTKSTRQHSETLRIKHTL